MTQTPVTVLAILDGFGYTKSQVGNAIQAASTPNLDELWGHYPRMLLKAAEEEVGLGFGETGNSEVGHMTIGSGRIIPQNLNRISKSILDGSFQQNFALLAAIKVAKDRNVPLHLIGMVSTGGVHSHLYHYIEIIRMAAHQGISRINLHLISDGRDSGKFDSPLFIQEINKVCQEVGVAKYVSLAGRAYSMDRNKNWDRTEAGYKVLFGNADKIFDNPEQALNFYYEQGLDDENIPATKLSSDQNDYLNDNAVIIITNFREDRARQLTQALTQPGFNYFRTLHNPQNLHVCTLTQYSPELKVDVAFPPLRITNTLSDAISQAGISQVHIAETEKYAHITYFFNGGREDKAQLEEFVLIPSYSPEEFVDHPEMSAPKIAEAVMNALSNDVKFIVFNFANGDMIGHTGKFDVTVKAIETMDQLLKPIIDQVLAKDGYLFLTADHGNCEEMVNLLTQREIKNHTTAPVPFIIVANKYRKEGSAVKILTESRISGVLADIAPTILTHLQLPVPPEMSGNNVFPV